MRAIVYERYGAPDVLQLREVEEPACGERDVLVRVRAAALGAGDWHLLRATWLAVRLYQGLLRPRRRILGHDLAGTVVEVGARVTRFRPGDEVFGTSLRAGAFAELACVFEQGLVHRPAGLGPLQAAAAPSSGLTALQGLRDKGRLRAGHRILVNGASGGVGTFAVQIARALGAEVTGVCSRPKMDAVRALGAEQVLDHGREDFTLRPERYELVLDNVGNRPLAACRRTLRPQGTYVAVSGHPLRTLWVVLAGGRQMVSFIARPDLGDLEFLRELLESGKVTAVIDRTFPLEQVPEAFRHYSRGGVRGKIVIAVRSTQDQARGEPT